MSEFQQIIQEQNSQKVKEPNLFEELMKDKVFCALMIESFLIEFVDAVVKSVFPDKNN